MESVSSPEFNISLSFESVNLPPVTDVLVLGRKYPHGKHGVLQAFKYIAPDEFQCIQENDDGVVGAVLASKKILLKMPRETLLSLLQKFVFPYVADEEAIKVDINIILSQKGIKGVL
ncbi:MAG: hypothetical protein ACOY32_04915 [Thermodesulfobacteriota bacterium]